ncbi:hypothetical protein EB796_002750 [Bugula neritina]|uniref:Uncharacterized protein n=1 Tax=Bugula neritina TaxID=10212 RepID=A0A7J7KK31_BUGNE|nr:hypothetical protein EB796_002750 [Bugula neritina]
MAFCMKQTSFLEFHSPTFGLSMIRHWLGSMLFELRRQPALFGQLRALQRSQHQLQLPWWYKFHFYTKQCVGIDKSGVWTLSDCQLNLTAVICQQNRGTHLDIASITITIY